jgi:transcriptional regulator with XRE-family HTH domain
MDGYARPCLGSTQPGLGPEASLSLIVVTDTRQSKSKKPVPIIRGILGRNVEVLRDQVYADLPTVTARNKKLAEKIGQPKGLSQIQRICTGELGTSIDTVEWLADALGVRPHDLLTPYFATAKGAPPSQPPPAADEAPLQRRKG